MNHKAPQKTKVLAHIVKQILVFIWDDVNFFCCQQETRYQPPLLPTSYPVQTTEVVRQINGSLMVPMEGGSRPGSVIKTNHVLPPISSPYPPVTDDEDEVDEGLGGPASQEHPEDQDSETNSSQVSYPLSNGSLRPKIRPLTPIVSPHASLIHKAQIV